MKKMICLLTLIFSNYSLSDDMLKICDLDSNTECLNKVSKPLASLSKINGYQVSNSKSEQVELILLANNIEMVYPELVEYTLTGEKVIDYHALSAVMIESIKSLASKNNALEKRVVQLEGMISTFK